MKKILFSPIAALTFASPVFAQSIFVPQISQFLDSYFQAAIRGEDTAKFFCKPERKISFSSPTAYLTMRTRGVLQDGYSAKVRVNLSNDSGVPIVKFYEFQISQNRKTCIDTFYELSN